MAPREHIEYVETLAHNPVSVQLWATLTIATAELCQRFDSCKKSFPFRLGLCWVRLVWRWQKFTHHWWVIEPFSWKKIKLPGSRDISWVILLPGGQFGQLYSSDAPSLWTSGASSASPVTTGSAYGFLTGTWQRYRGYRGYEMIWTRFNKWVELLTNLVQKTARIPFMPRYWENVYQKTATNLDCKVRSNYNTSASSCLERDLFGVDLSWRIQISHL